MSNLNPKILAPATVQVLYLTHCEICGLTVFFGVWISATHGIF
jgi:hypothetical protein